MSTLYNFQNIYIYTLLFDTGKSIDPCFDLKGPPFWRVETPKIEVKWVTISRSPWGYGPVQSRAGRNIRLFHGVFRCF